MKKLFLIIFVFSLGGKAQQLDTISSYRLLDTISSKYLKSDRALKIQLPRSYDIETKKKYPLIIVMDGDYLFDITSGSVDYLSYWGDIPENIVVGVNQFGSRFEDSSVLDEFNFTPISSTSNFYDFLEGGKPHLWQHLLNFVLTEDHHQKNLDLRLHLLPEHLFQEKQGA